MVRGFLAMGAATLLALVVVTGARAGDCAGCGTVLASAQGSEQVLPAPQGECYAPVTYCEEKAGCDLLGKMKGLGHGLGCKVKGLGHGVGCKLDSMACGVGDLCGGLKGKIGGLGHGLKCKLSSLGSKCHTAPAPCYAPCVMPTEQCAAPSPQGIVTAAPQFPSAQ
jgi:hypothetical protein